MNRQGHQAAPTYARSRICWACARPFTQRGPGRNHVVCYAARCERRRAAYRRRSGAALDRMEG